jgi:hypothetical protein
MSDLRSVFTTLGASNHVAGERAENDYYATHPQAVDYLLKNFNIPQATKIWECACGEGHLSKRLVERGYQVHSTDIANRGYGEKLNFFDHTEKLDGNTVILTNPPYKYAMEFVLHALELLPDDGYCMMFLKLLFLEGQERYGKLFREYPPLKALVFSKRMRCAKNGVFGTNGKEYSSAMAYSWFIWRKGFKGKPVIEWI